MFTTKKKKKKPTLRFLINGPSRLLILRKSGHPPPGLIRTPPFINFENFDFVVEKNPSFY